MSRESGEQLTGRTALHIPVAAATTIYKGDFVAVDATGYAVKPDKVTGLIKAGMAVSDADNSAGEAGAVYVDVERGVYVFSHAGDIKETDLLKECYFAGADSVSLTGKTTSSAAGIIVSVDSDTAAVDMF